MRSEPVNIAIWFQSPHKNFNLSGPENDALNIEYGKHLRIMNIPITHRDENRTPEGSLQQEQRAADFLTLNIMVYATLAFLVSKLFEGVLKPLRCLRWVG